MSKKSVLVIDDDPAITDMLQVGLDDAGYDVHTASGADEMWGILKKSKPDIILMDIGMPGTDGITLCRNIRISPELKHIPILMITAFSDEKTQHDSILFGASGFLSKPLEIDEIVSKMEEAFSKKI